jgi:hypothetical protein
VTGCTTNETPASALGSEQLTGESTKRRRINMPQAECGRGWADRCRTATGSKCTCRCGGANHGTLADRPAGILKLDGSRNSREANFRIEYDGPEGLVLLDVGPWDRHPTITNDAASVVRMAASGLAGRRLFYFDTDGRLDELKVVGGQFTGFASGAPIEVREAIRRNARRRVAV